MALQGALDPSIRAAVADRAATLPVFDESTFGRDYFTGISN